MQMRIVKQRVNAVHRHGRNIGLLQRCGPFRRAARDHYLGNKFVHLADMRGARGMVAKSRIFEQVFAFNQFEKILPVFIVVNQHA